MAVHRKCFEALSTLHAAGILHRAINPDRVYITTGGAIAFTDLLIARLDGELSIVGYADDFDYDALQRAPECRTDFGLCSERTDVYSLAATIYYWLTGQEYADDSPIPQQLQQTRPELTAPLRSALSSFFERCLQ